MPRWSATGCVVTRTRGTAKVLAGSTCREIMNIIEEDAKRRNFSKPKCVGIFCYDPEADGYHSGKKLDGKFQVYTNPNIINERY
jgi:hypothetical protein